MLQANRCYNYPIKVKVFCGFTNRSILFFPGQAETSIPEIPEIKMEAKLINRFSIEAVVYSGTFIDVHEVPSNRPIPQPRRLYSSTLYPGGCIE